MPRRFYCRAKWHSQRRRQRNAGLRSRFRRPGWPPAGRNSRVHGETRAPGGVVARTRRRCHPAAVHPRLARGAAAGGERRYRRCERHLADCRVRRTGGQCCLAASRSTGLPIRSPWEQLLAQAHERGVPVSGVVWRSTAPERRGVERRSRRAARGRDRQPAQRRAHRARRLTNGSVKLPADCGSSPSGPWRPNPASRSTRCRRRSGGSGAPSSTRNRPCAANWSIATDQRRRCSSLANLLATPVDEPELALRQGKLLVSRLLPWARSGHLAVPRSSRLRPGAHRTRRDRQPASDRDGRAAAGRGLRAGPGGGRGSQLPRCAQRARSLPGRSGTDRRGLRRHRHRSWVAASPDSRSASASTASCRARSPAGSMCRRSCWRRCPTG